MKKRYLSLSIILWLSFSSLNAQKGVFEFGIPTLNDLKMKAYEKDSTAAAVVLYEYGNASIKYAENIGPRLYITRRTRIKILKKQAQDLGQITVPLRKSLNSKNKEKISGIKAVSINTAQDGAYKTARLESSKIFKEEYNEQFTLIKFIIPNVTTGSIIDYEYTVESPFLYNFYPWEFQTNIPKVYSEYITSIPVNYKYNIKLTGDKEMIINENDLVRNCFIIEGLGSAACRTAIYAMKDIPAFIEEDYMLAPENFKLRLSYELEEFNHFDGKKDKYTKTWKNADEELRDADQLGNQSNKQNYFKKRLSPDLLLEENDLIRAKKIYNHLQQTMNWNNEHGVFGKKDIKQAFDANTGSSTELNLILLNSLKAANLNADIMLLATRENQLPTTLYPVLSEFNYLVIKLNINDKSYLLDITDKKIPFGMIPYKCLNSYGRVFDFKKGSYWYNINPDVYKSKRITQLSVKIDTSGSIHGKVRKSESGYYALSKRHDLLDKNEADYIDDMESNLSTKLDFEITDFKITNKDSYEKPITETINFRIEDPTVSDQIYFYPFIFNRFTKNPFNLTERNYPIDFGHSFSYNYLVLIDIPENMEYVNIPKSNVLKLQDGLAEVILKTDQMGQKISMTLNLDIKTPVYLAENYEALKNLFSELITIQNKMPVVIKKK